MSIVEWVLGVISGSLVLAIGALFRMALENEHRVSVLETQHAHIGEQLDRIEEKITLLMKRRA